MAGLAGLREGTGNVVGIGRALEILQVAGNAGARRQIVVAVDVAVGTEPRRYCVRAGQREIDSTVVKRGRRPGLNRMTSLASRSEIQ